MNPCFQRMTSITFTAILLLIVSGCYTQTSLVRSHHHSYSRSPSTREELYFGTQLPSGDTVTEGEWNAFMDEEVTPRFPNGFTVLTGYGQFRYESGKLGVEQTRIVIIFDRSPSPHHDRLIEEIISAYKRQFHQESVLRATTFVEMRF